MEYTEGEWKVRSGFKVTCGEEQIWIADCYPYHEKHPRPRIVEAEANANIMAASKDMYHVLKRAQVQLARHNIELPALTPLEEEIQRVLARVEGT